MALNYGLGKEGNISDARNPYADSRLGHLIWKYYLFYPTGHHLRSIYVQIFRSHNFSVLNREHKLEKLLWFLFPPFDSTE
jgi:hypothetical protein